MINLNTFTKKIFSLYFTNTVRHLKGGGEAKKRTDFLANNVFNTNTLNTCEFYVWRIYFEWCLVASMQIFAVQKLYVERFNFQCVHLLVLGIKTYSYVHISIFWLKDTFPPKTETARDLKF